MLLGKRPRQYNPMKRTTSMKEIIFDPIHANPDHQIIDGGGNTATTYLHPHHHQQPSDQIGAVRGGAEATAAMLDQRNATATAAWGGGGVGAVLNHHHQMQRRHSADFVENYLSANQNNHLSSNFLRDCALCKRRLIPGRDIFMYRGDSAFCSSECRQQQISKDQREEKCSLSKRAGSGGGGGGGGAGADNNNNKSNSTNSSSAKVSVK